MHGYTGMRFRTVAIRLIEGEEPVVVFIAVIAHRQPENAASGVDVVAGRQDSGHVLVDGLRERLGDLALPLRRRRLANADAEVADDRKAHRPHRLSDLGAGCVRNAFS